MGWANPPMPWQEIERTLSGRPAAPSESTHPEPERAAPQAPRPNRTRYAELHAHSSYSFLDGASSPEALVAEAQRQELEALAITDHDGFYGLVRFAEAAEGTDVGTVFGAELSLSLTTDQKGSADPESEHLLVLARGTEGYHRLAEAITSAQLRGGEKGRPHYDLDELAVLGRGHWAVLTGCRKGAVGRALADPVSRGDDDLTAAERAVGGLVDRFGRDDVFVELTRHGDPLDDRRLDALASLADRARLPLLATNNVHYAAPEKARLARAVAAIRATRSMDDLDGWLPAHNAAHLRSGDEMARLFARYPGAVERTADLAADLAFPLRLGRPRLPRTEVPEGHTPMSHLRDLVWRAVPHRYPHLTDDQRSRIRHELDVIESKDFPGYFLIVHEIVEEARRRGILCQGRGSAAASAVCYLLGITAVDAIAYGLPFERFLSAMREEEPDIDVDFDSDRREEIIQWVYDRYGRDRAAQVANVIQYRPKNAVRDVARALGYSPGQQDAFSRRVERAGALGSEGNDLPPQVVEYASELMKAPRHLGIHSGGMVLTDRPVGEVVPVEHARMENRTVIQWDKDDAAWMGLVKFDLLGLGMLSALQHSFDLIRGATGETWRLDGIPREEPAVYDMLCRADAIGVFQVESRAQMGLLPRLQPRSFYDLAIQIALIRPGPIQGGAVHPFVRRKMGRDPVTYPHPALEPVLRRTLGIPVFQEQLMQMAMVIGDCTAEDADLLRRAMGSKRGLERIDRVRDTLYAGMARHGLSQEASDAIYAQIQAFANFGFAESHSLSFALLVYASSWIKLHYPAAFLAGLLRAQPMGFYSAATLTADARRHGVEVLRPDINRSGAQEELEQEAPDARSGPIGQRARPGGRPSAESTGRSPGDADHASNTPTGRDACLTDHAFDEPTAFDPSADDDSSAHRRDRRFAVRLGLAGVTGVGLRTARRVVASREEDGPFASQHDLVRRTGVSEKQLESLATAGAFSSIGHSVRESLWAAGAAAQDRPEYLPGTVQSVQPPLFADPTSYERLVGDLWATGVSTDDHPLAHFRPALEARGVLSSVGLRTHETGRRVEVAGLVTHRQRPATASGITFLNLEDECGLVNVICSAGAWARYRTVVRDSPALIARGILERSPEGVINLTADAFEPLRTGTPHRSRDFR
ncbi:error-prone DNA polymerase [Microbacterium sp. JB110]|uniref:error-prone DNA polymerase n=1 Tax=Microbacterium sp. JB110 TaxID=2024477 RepID=UPI00097F5545|nr:error-prone DNA polymerase [Microbacterium sp. JB110]RCS63222.1 DNA polymerase III subunit alpha [Microbacterium sp. JB110]SJM52190.1 DNA polymerase III alpha subunit [Frigoribacterium sp. JB110]